MYAHLETKGEEAQLSLASVYILWSLKDQNIECNMLYCTLSRKLMMSVVFLKYDRVLLLSHRLKGHGKATLNMHDTGF